MALTKRNFCLVLAITVGVGRHYFKSIWKLWAKECGTTHIHTHTNTWISTKSTCSVQMHFFWGGKRTYFQSAVGWIHRYRICGWVKANNVCKGEVLSSSQTLQYSSLCSPGPCLFRSSLIVRNPGRHHSCLLAVTCCPPAFFCGNRTVRGAVPCGHPAPLAREPELSLSPWYETCGVTVSVIPWIRTSALPRPFRVKYSWKTRGNMFCPSWLNFKLEEVCTHKVDSLAKSLEHLLSALSAYGPHPGRVFQRPPFPSSLLYSLSCCSPRQAS